jgi:hypothetical protein
MFDPIEFRKQEDVRVRFNAVYWIGIVVVLAVVIVLVITH